LVGVAAFLAVRSPLSTVRVIAQPTRAEVTSMSLEAAIEALNLMHSAHPLLVADFTIPTLDEGRFRLTDQRGKVVFVNFWATWCPPCREEMPTMERLWRHHQRQPFVMLAVSIDADPAGVRPLITQQGFTFTVGIDPGQQLVRKFRAQGLPATSVVDRQGRVAAAALGARTWDSVPAHALIDRLLQ
jgi:cytochrome c biogenesis protein CcmG, thiol:disulfide interchange protein DsbE